MERDVVCGMQVDPAKAAGYERVQRQDVLLLLEGLQDQVRREPQPVREVTAVRAAFPASGRQRRMDQPGV